MKFIVILSLFSLPVLGEQIDINTPKKSLDFAQVKNVVATKKPNGSWCFGTSVQHNDEGWEHYADAWEVIDLKGNQLGFRKFGHPHDNEQPFMRSQCNIKIPCEVSKVIVRAKCNKHGYGGKAMVVDLNNI